MFIVSEIVIIVSALKRCAGVTLLPVGGHKWLNRIETTRRKSNMTIIFRMPPPPLPDVFDLPDLGSLVAKLVFLVFFFAMML